MVGPTHDVSAADGHEQVAWIEPSRETRDQTRVDRNADRNASKDPCAVDHRHGPHRGRRRRAADAHSATANLRSGNAALELPKRRDVPATERPLEPRIAREL